ncbi:hypothetical protein C5Y96_21390 [Blastopirellula marina]|uniref:Carboxypeptidase regulatory-like domain-containing protein n=1 Tax=Blastopirellula marina TaxID=124 RepID=A0A2S8F1G1_9BACT|nr:MULTISPECIES: hypothetical protein [Pirellulaceae]PQO26008.1 hypothetical protein C5Y96_21390 [Blastopirellula marina]RCS44366.1 hypothetical protein DTL36_21435 [Bremerella cremea]
MAGCLRLVLVMLCLSVLGCQQGTSDDRFAGTSEITGTVTLNGTPLESGQIQFTSPEDISNGSEAFAEISAGTYTARVTPGKKKVLIRSPKPVGKPDETGLVATQETIPAEYNQRTTLTADIPQGEGKIDFDLK